MRTRRKTTRRRVAGGFTIVELMIVVLLTAMLALVALPALASMSRVRTSGTARAAVSQLQYAQTRAVLTRRAHYVRLDGGTLRLFCDSDGGGFEAVPDPADGLSGGGMGLVLDGDAESDSRGVTGVLDVHTTFTVLCFDEAGTPLAARPDNMLDRVYLSDDVTLTLSAGDDALTVRVDASTGEVTLD